MTDRHADTEAELPFELIIDEVGRFARERVALPTARHECPMSAEVLAGLAQEAVQLGILPQRDSGDVGLWEDVASAAGRRLSVGMLRTLSVANTGFGWHLHETALALWLARALAIDGAGLLVATQGRYGLARHSLARYLQGDVPSAEDRLMLNDCYGAVANRRLVLATEPWQRVLLPLWREDTGMQWALFERDSVESACHGRLHGIDELAGFELQPRKGDAIWHSALAPERARSVLCSALALQALGQLALAHGALRRGFKLAADYAAQRRQGGVVIREHAAVQMLLGTARSTLATADAWLERLVALEPQRPESLHMILLARASLHPTICEAANACLQVLGGSGYMRDAGLEKVVRDCNLLRLLHGTPPELRLFSAAFSIGESAIA